MPSVVSDRCNYQLESVSASRTIPCDFRRPTVGPDEGRTSSAVHGPGGGRTETELNAGVAAQILACVAATELEKPWLRMQNSNLVNLIDTVIAMPL